MNEVDKVPNLGEIHQASAFADRESYLSANGSDLFKPVYDERLSLLLSNWNDNPRRVVQKTIEEAEEMWGKDAQLEASAVVRFRDQLKTELSKVEYDVLPEEAQSMVFTLSTANLCFGPSYYGKQSWVSNLQLNRMGCPVEDRVKMGRSHPSRINPDAWDRNNINPEPQFAGAEFDDITHATIVDFTELMESAGLVKFVEKFCDDPVELTDNTGRREIHIPTAFGFTLAYIEKDETRRLIAYPSDNVYSSNKVESEIFLSEDFDKPVIDWPETTKDRDLAQLSLIKAGTTIINADDSTISGLVTSGMLFNEGVRPELRMTNVPSNSVRRSVGSQGKLPTKQEMGVDGYWGSFDPYRVLVLDPNVSLVENDVKNKNLTYGYDPDTIVSILVALPLRNSGKGIIETTFQKVTYYLRFNPEGHTSLRKVVEKSKRTKTGKEVLQAIRNDSAMIANAVEQAGLQHPILAGLPSLGKKR